MTVDKEVINRQIRALGEFSTFGTKKEIRYLPEVIHEGELIKALGSGFWNGNTWLIVVTDRRVLFLDKGMIAGLKQVEIPLRNISAVSYKTGFIMGEVSVHVMGKHQEIEQMQKSDAKRVSEVISSLLHEETTSSTAVEKSDDPLDKLERLAVLMEKGLVTEDEFLEQKKKLLKSM